MSRPRGPSGAHGPSISPGVHAGRRERVLTRIVDDALVVPAAPVRHRSRDAEYRYRPDSDLFWLTGLVEPGAVAVLRGFGDDDRFVLFVRPNDEKAERWTGARLGPAGAEEALGADAAYPLDALEDELPELLAGARRVYFRPGSSDRVGRIVEEAIRDARSKGQRAGRGPRGIIDPGEVLDELRLVKDDAEVTLIRRAAGITVDAHRALLAGLGPGVGEWELEAAFDAAVRRAGARGPAFATIVASGANACTLHYVANRGRVKDDDLVLVDGGAEVECYAGDVTRTVPASGRFTGVERAVYEVVLDAHRRALDAGGPGASLDDVHGAAVAALAEGLVELGVLEGDPEELVEEDEHEAFVPHKTSHWLGLDVHDVGDYAVDGEPRALVPGMVYTVEPGLYFPPDAGGPERCAGVGVRIEDDVLVTAAGVEVLTDDLPVDPDEIAGLVGAS